MTEAVTGVDLVQAQLRIAGGESLVELGLTQSQIPAARGFAIQARVNMETLSADGQTRPGGGTLTAFEPPTGPGVRTDTYGYAGYATNPAFDSLLAKVIGHSSSPDFANAVVSLSGRGSGWRRGTSSGFARTPGEEASGPADSSIAVPGAVRLSLSHLPALQKRRKSSRGDIPP